VEIPQRSVASKEAIGAVLWMQLSDELLLHHRFLRRKLLGQVNKTQQTADVGGLITSARGKTSARQRGGWKRNPCRSVGWGISLPYLVLVTLWSPDSSTREHRDKEVTT
jgi:hypothetical protein